MTDVTSSGFIAVAGRPNAGKSTLINRLVGSHVAIVSPIAQTTRRVVRAAVTHEDTQLVFVDLPGSQRPVDRLTSRMQSSVESALGDVDAVLWVIDGSDEPRRGERIVADLVFAAGAPVVIALNKVDRLSPKQIGHRITQLVQIIGLREYTALVPVSAKTGDGCDAIVTELRALMPAGPAYFPDENVTDMRVSERIAEYVREAALQHVREELPHATIAEVEEIDESGGGMVITCILWVETESQRVIVVGSGGDMIRQISMEARQLVEGALGRSVYLHVRVKVRPRWRNDDTWLARAGL